MSAKRVRSFLEKHRVYVVDTMVFIYHFEDHKRYAETTQRLLEALENGTNQGLTSIVTLLEILVKPKREENWDAVRDYRDLLMTFPNLTMVPVDEACAQKASDLRAHYGLRTPDAIQIASALLGGATAYVTNDDQLKQVTELEVILLEELLK